MNRLHPVVLCVLNVLQSGFCAASSNSQSGRVMGVHPVDVTQLAAHANTLECAKCSQQGDNVCKRRCKQRLSGCVCSFKDPMWTIWLHLGFLYWKKLNMRALIYVHAHRMMIVN